MDGDRWRRVEEIFLSAMERPPARRQAYLDEVCDDRELRREVEGLLAADARAGDFLDDPALGRLSDVVPGDALSGESAIHVLSPGMVLAGRFRVIRFVAAGGMGEVYEAEDLELGGRLAIKTVRPEIADDREVMERFRREVQLARNVTHPAVCRCHDIFHHEPDRWPIDHAPGPDSDDADTLAEIHGFDRSLTFLSMELLEGDTLADVLRRDGVWSPRRALPIIEQVAAGLAAAHEHGVVHRDLKPANIILVAAPGAPGSVRPVITDFGLARRSAGEPGPGSTVTRRGSLVGTPSYMAPEQLDGGEITPATDVYALGILTYEMVTGRLPFEAETAHAVAFKRLTTDPVPPRTHAPGLSARWQEAILRCLAREPDRRFGDCLEVVRALGGADPGVRRKVGFLSRGIPARVAGVAAVAALALAGISATAVVGHCRGGVESSTAAGVATGRWPRRAVAVLGLRNLTGDPETAWLSGALSEMLAMELGRGTELYAVPGASVARMKQDLELVDAASLDRDTLARVRAHLGVDLAVVGAYYASDAGQEGAVRLDVRVEDAASGTTLALLTEEGSQANLLQLVARAGQKLRAALGHESSSPALEQAPDELERGGLPGSPEAARLYADGVARLRRFDALGARELLERAATLEGDAPLIHVALAEALATLGHDAAAAAAARRAHELGGELVREERLWVEARYHETSHAWQRAAEIYRTLHEFHPENLDYGLRLAAMLTEAGEGERALGVLGELRAVPGSGVREPRIDLAEAEAADALSDHRRARDAARRAVQRSQALGARWLLARAHYRLARAFYRLGEHDEARAAAEQALATFRDATDRSGQADAVNLLALIAENRAQLAKADMMYSDALALYRAIGDQAGIMLVLNNQSIVRVRQGRHHEAQAMLEECADIARAIANQEGTSRALQTLAWLYRSRADYETATTYYRQGLEVARTIHHKQLESSALISLAAVLTRQGQLGEAADMYREALPIARSTGDRDGEARCLYELADTLRRSGDVEGAARAYRETVELARTIADERKLARALSGMAMVSRMQGELSAAIDDTRRAAEIHGRIDDAEGRALNLHAAALVAVAAGRLTEARAQLDLAGDLLRQIEDHPGVAVIRYELAALDLEAGELARAERETRDVIASLAGSGQRDDELAAWTLLARIQLARGRQARARESMDRARSLASNSQYLVGRLRSRLVRAELDGAAGRVTPARDLAGAVAREASTAGLEALALEARFVRATVALTADEAAARRELTAVAEAAAERGFDLIRSRAASLTDSTADSRLHR